MPHTIHAQPDTNPAFTGTTTVPAGHGWLPAAQAQITTTAGVLTVTAIAAVTAALATYLFLRRPSKPDLSKHLMYVPLLLVNSAAIYGQVAFFYEQVAPAGWPIPGKLALSVLVAAAIESIAVYVGWHAHDALLNKASATAARLRRASYLLALIVGLINYWHFAGDGLFDPTAASVAFGLLSLLSPWLWGLHTRRAQHVQLTNEGAIDVAGATFSGDRIRMFPYRAYMARRWSIDHYVTDPQQAWQGYNADRDRARAIKPGTRLRAAWMILAGHADVEPGSMPTPVPSMGDRTFAPAFSPAAIEASQEITQPLAQPEKAGPTQSANPAANVPANTPGKPLAKRIEKPAEKAVGAAKPFAHPLGDDLNPSIRALARAFAKNPAKTNPELAKLAKVSTGTANRYLPQIRAAAVDSANADADELRAESPLTPLPISEPKWPVLQGTNGHTPTLTEENR